MKSAKILFIIAFLLAFAFQVSAQSAQFPNELEGFQFFGKGKLKKLTLGLSMKKDVELIFGELCEKNNCDYDENFTISINYLYEDDCMTTQVVRDRIMCPLSKFVGTIFSVELKPKRAFRFKEILTSNFNILGSGSLREKGSGESISYLSFSDKHGLKYSVYDEIADQKESGKSIFTDGDLYSVTYNLSEELEDNIFKAEFEAKNN